MKPIVFLIRTLLKVLSIILHRDFAVRIYITSFFRLQYQEDSGHTSAPSFMLQRVGILGSGYTLPIRMLRAGKQDLVTYNFVPWPL